MILNPANKSKIRGKIRVFFGSPGWKNTLVFFSFVVLASGFWALQYFRQQFEFEVPLKIYYVHVPTEIALSDNLPQEMLLHVQDKGSAYLNYLLKQRKQSLSVTVDLQAISPSKTSYLVDQTALYGLIEEKLYATTQLKSFSPERIEINYSSLVQKKLPVMVNGTIVPAPGYLFMDSIRIEPAQVTAYGNKNTLDTLYAIRTLPLEYRNIENNWSISAGLQVPDGVHLLVDQVKLSATVEEYTEKTFELPVVCYNMPANRSVRFFPSTVELGVSIGLSEYSRLLKSDFEIAVNYNDLAGKNRASCSLSLTRKPGRLENYRIVPNVIEFLIEQKSN